MLNALRKGCRVLRRRLRNQGVRTTALWAYARGVPKVTGVPMLAYSRVTPSLYVGPQHRASGKRALARAGITHIVNMRSEFDDAAHGLAFDDSNGGDARGIALDDSNDNGAHGLAFDDSNRDDAHGLALDDSNDGARGLALDAAPGNAHQASARYCHLPTPDDHAPTDAQLAEGAEFIRAAIDGGGKVYIHCSAGVGRAPTMAAAYLMMKQKRGMDDALALIAAARPFIYIAPPQTAALRRLEAALTATDAAPTDAAAAPSAPTGATSSAAAPRE